VRAVVVEVEGASVAGFVRCCDDGRILAFDGWLDLLRVLELALEGGRPDPELPT
jgi:hypothetical protein